MSVAERYASIGRTPPVEEPTLRDRFAMAALPAWIQVICKGNYNEHGAADIAAELAYETADRMEARK